MGFRVEIYVSSHSKENVSLIQREDCNELCWIYPKIWQFLESKALREPIKVLVRIVLGRMRREKARP